MKSEVDHFKAACQDFNGLKKNKEIPPQMEVKLQYLLCKIMNRSEEKIANISDLPDYERNSLDQLNKQTGIQLFCNIVGCLSGKDVVLYFRDEKAYIRKDERFSMWSTCFITCDSGTIYIKKKPQKNPYHEFHLMDLRISKNYKLYKKKNVFGAVYKKKESYLIGFDLELVCARMHELFRNLIREKVGRERGTNISESVRHSISRVSIESSPNEKREEQSGRKMIKEKEENAMQTNEGEGEEMDENEEKVLEIIKEYEMIREEVYSLRKNEGAYREFIHKKYPNKLKQVILLEGKEVKSAFSILNMYIQFNAWNPEIEQCRILTKISANCYLLEVKAKKYSYMAWPRGVVIVAEAVIYKENSYLVIRSVEQEPSFSDTVKMEWNQIIEVCLAKDASKILLTVVSELDFKGYCSIEDSQRMGLKVMDNLKHFGVYIDSKQLSGKVDNIFNVEGLRRKNLAVKLKEQQKKSEEKKEEKKQRKMSESSQFDIPDEIEDQSQVIESEINGKKNKIGHCEVSHPEMEEPMNFIMYLMKSDQNSEVSPELAKKIREKWHERYYLRHKFDQKPHLDVSLLEHGVEEPNHYVLQNGDWIMNEDNDAIFTNQKIIDLQKDTIKMIIKQLSSNLMSGKSIMNMSLPVEIFDGRSILERVAMGFGFAPKILTPAGQTTDIIEQAKLVTSFMIGLMPLHLNMTKPFNPILGETFECKIAGVPVYLQQISHHPPISAFYMPTQDFKLYGSFHSHAEMGLNQVHGRNLTPIYVEFPKTKTLYEIKTMDMEINGMLYGDKRYRPSGKAFIHERTNNLFIEYSTGKEKKKVYEAKGKVKPNLFYGGIFTVTDRFGKKFRECENKKKFDGLKPDDIVETHSKMLAHWCLFVSFDDEKIRVLEDPLPNKIDYPPYLLPSDSNLRLDLIYKRMGQLKTSNEEKEILENIQRKDKKLREGKIK